MKIKSKKQALNHVIDKHNNANVIDYLRELSEGFPVILDQQGKPVNHFRKLKELFRSGGKDAVIEYMRDLSDTVIEKHYKTWYKVIYFKLKLRTQRLCHRIISTAKQTAKQ